MREFLTPDILEDMEKGKNHFIPRWQLDDGSVQRDPIDHRHMVWILGAFDNLDRRFAVLGRLLHSHATLAKVHQNLIDRQPVQPSREGRLTPKAANFSKELYENLLREVFGL